MTTRLPIVQRSCGACSACCTIVGVESIGKPAGARCSFERAIHPELGRCSVYATRPGGCRQYACLWLLGGLDNEADRPDALGVMLDAYRTPDGSVGVIAHETEAGGFMRALPRLRSLARKSVGMVPARPMLIRWHNGDFHSAFDGETIGPPPFEIEEAR